jgi:hypothetical protein
MDASGSVLTVNRAAPTGEQIRLVANLTAQPQPWAAPPGWSPLLDSTDPRFAGSGRETPLAPFQAVLFEVVR